MRLQHYSTRLYRGLGEAVGYPVGYNVTGSLRLAHTEARMDEYRHVRDTGRANGIGYELLRPEEAKARYPFLELDDLVGALWDPEDGDIDPEQLTQALAAGARQLGAVVRRGCRVMGIEWRGWEWEVRTGGGDVVRCEVVVNAAGYRAGEVMGLLGQHLPVVAMEHQYLVTEDVPELVARGGKLPVLRDPDVSYYLRQERQGLLLGPYEWQATPMWLEGIPEDFAYGLAADDLGRLERYVEAACARVPILGTVGVKRVVNGPIPYSPDGNPYIGPAHGLRGFYHCNTFSFGIAQAGGAGKALAEWVIDGAPEWDLWALDPRRYTGYATRSYTLAKAVEVYQNEYAPAFPFEERPAGRPLRTSPLYPLLKAKGARFGARGGWERALYFDPDGSVGEPSLSFRRQRNWFGRVGEEVRAVREAAGLLDLLGLAKFRVEGPGAAAALDRLLCTRLPRVGRAALGYALDGRGGIVSELTVARLGEERFYLCSEAAAEWHNLDWLRAGLSVPVDELTARLGTLVLAGPRAREVLARVVERDLATESFPWLGATEVEIGSARGLLLRMSCLGELGYELHLPEEHMVAVYERLLTAGAREIGIHAVESLRLDKGYPAWKRDIDLSTSPLMAGLERLVDFGKPAFVGREALLEEQERGPAERLVSLVLDEAGEADPLPMASVWKDGKRVGQVTSAGWSYTLERGVALAYVRRDLAEAGVLVEVTVLGVPRPAVVATEPLYDPTNVRLKA
jgi:dimethylglycine dehydrogenase